MIDAAAGSSRGRDWRNSLLQWSTMHRLEHSAQVYRYRWGRPDIYFFCAIYCYILYITVIIVYRYGKAVRYRYGTRLQIPVYQVRYRTVGRNIQ